MRTYKLLFLKPAKKEWDKLAPTIKEQFRKKLIQRLETPHVPKDRLSGLDHCYKIKLRDAGYRLVYKVIDQQVIVEVIAVGKRNNMDVYRKVHERLN